MADGNGPLSCSSMTKEPHACHNLVLSTTPEEASFSRKRAKAWSRLQVVQTLLREVAGDPIAVGITASTLPPLTRC
jgi:hypothetical protein